MSDIELVIKIPEEDYDYLYVRKEVDGEELSYYEYLIFKGIPLPKGHGELVDRNEVTKNMELESDCYYCDYDSFKPIRDAQTIIEADEESEE